MEEWDGAIDQVVQELGSDFDSHQVILKVAHRNQRRYIDALAQTEGETPFHRFHRRLGERIQVVCGRRGLIGQSARSADIFGRTDSDCRRWTRG